MNWAEGWELLPTHTLQLFGNSSHLCGTLQDPMEPAQSAKAGQEMEPSPLF